MNPFDDFISREMSSDRPTINYGSDHVANREHFFFVVFEDLLKVSRVLGPTLLRYRPIEQTVICQIIMAPAVIESARDI